MTYAFKHPIPKRKVSIRSTSSRPLTLMSPGLSPRDLFTDPTLLAMLLSIPNLEAIVKDIVKSSMFAKKCIESQVKALFLCLEGPTYLIFVHGVVAANSGMSALSESETAIESLSAQLSADSVSTTFCTRRSNAAIVCLTSSTLDSSSALSDGK